MLEQLIYLAFMSVGLGFAVWRLLGIKEEDDMSALFLWAGTGIAAFVPLAVVFGFLSLSSWYVYGAVALALVVLAARKGDIAPRLPRIDRGWAIVLLLFFIHFYVYVSGALNYPWLEDDDPWSHAAAVRYVSIYSTYILPNPELIHYLAPYPPFFDVLLGLLFQLDTGSLQFTLKFFNALLVSLTIPLFYCWVRTRFEGRVALWATFIIAVLPSLMSHFIWAQTLAMVLVFPAFYFLERVLRGGDRALTLISALTLGAVLMVQPSVAGIIFIMVVLYVGSVRLPAILASGDKAAALKDSAAVPLLALALALLLFWGPMLAMYGMGGILNQMGLSLGFVTEKTPDTSGGVIYGPNDFLDAPLASKMDQPTGWGLAVSGLLLLGIVVAVRKARAGEDRWLQVALLLWFVFCMVGVEGNALPFKMMPHRFWVFLAIPVAILAGYGAVKVLEYTDKNRKGMELAAKVVLVAALLFTAAYPKGVVETSQWPPGASWASDEQVAGYIKLKGLPANTKVFGFCMNDVFADGVDKAGYAWVKEVNDYKAQSINDSLDGNYAFLKKYGYEYAIIDQSCLKTFSGDQIQAKLTALGPDSRFTLEQQFSSQSFLAMKVN